MKTRLQLSVNMRQEYKKHFLSQLRTEEIHAHGRLSTAALTTSIHESYTKLSEKLTERVRLPLLAAIDKYLNEQILNVTKVFVLCFNASCNAHWGCSS